MIRNAALFTFCYVFLAVIAGAAIGHVLDTVRGILIP